MHNVRLIVQSITHQSQEEILTEMLQLGGKKPPKLKNDPNEKSTRFSLIAHYDSETVNMTEGRITLNEAFSFMETSSEIKFNVIVGNDDPLSLSVNPRSK